MSHPIDYIVKTAIFEPTIIAAADRLRNALGQEHDTAITPLPALRWFQRQPVPNKGTLTIHPVDMPDGAPPARVKYNPLKLLIDRDILADAEKYSDPKAHEIISHEIGHILFHDNETKAFSESDAHRIRSVPKQFRAEWHAETFADHYLLPIKLVIAFGLDITKITNNCNVNDTIATRQIENARLIHKITSISCGECGRKTLSRMKGHMKCIFCKTEYSL